MFLIYGGNGWIGQKIVAILTSSKIPFIVSKVRADDIKSVEVEIKEIKPTNILCLLGRTHGTFDGEYIPTIDYLEKKGKVKENVRDNLFCPIALALICKKLDIHLTYLGTGCIFSYSEDKKIFKEEDEPNFFGSSYSVVKGYTDRLMHMFDNVLNVRIRMPISSDLSPRNFIMKLLKYEKICSMQNSMTVLDELLPVMCDMALNKEVGTVNLTNPGTIEHSEILDIYKEMIDPNFNYNLFSYEDQMKVIACDRSNNELDASAIQSRYKVLNIKDSVRIIMKKLLNAFQGYTKIITEKYTLFCGNEFHIPNYNNLLELVKTCEDTCCDILSPILLSTTGKIIFYGGTISRGELIIFDDKFITYEQVINSKMSFNYVKPSMVFSSRCFIIKNSLADKYNIEKPNFEDFINCDMRVTPFIIAKQLYGISYTYDKVNVNIFNFEKECAIENFNKNIAFGSFPLRVQNRKFLDASTKKYALIIESDLLTPDNDCGSAYMINFIKMLFKNGYIVHFICTNFRYTFKYTKSLQKMGVYVLYNSVNNIKTYLSINCNVYDTIFVSRFHEIKDHYDTIRMRSPKSKIVFITHDLSFIRNNRMKSIKGDEADSFQELEELSYVERSDLTVIVSEYEYNYVKSKNIKNIVYFPICYPLIPVTKRSRTRGIYFIGSRHTPNIDAINHFLKYLYEDILLIQEIPLYIFGQCCKGISEDLLEKFSSSITTKEYIEEDELLEFLKTVRINIVPLRYGAGVKGKILQASNNFVPTISTSVGIEGTVFEDKKDIIELNFDQPDYAIKLVSYYNDIEMLNEIAQNAHKTFSDNYSLKQGEVYMSKLVDRIENISLGKPKICVIFNTYNKPHIAKFLRDHLESIVSANTFDFYIVNNGNENIDDGTYDNFKIVQGDNSVNEFSGIQKCINDLVRESRIEEYTAFILCNDTIATNYTLDFIYKFNGMHLDIASRNIYATGQIDSFGEEISLDNFTFDKWYRTFFVIINAKLFRSMEYRFMNYTLEDVYDGDIMKIKISSDLKTRLEKWLSQERYIGADMKKKYTCIFNEYRFSHEIRKVLKN
jgi:3,5-epimerase/4-reductase